MDRFGGPDLVVRPSVKRQNHNHDEKHVRSYRVPKAVGEVESDYGGHCRRDDRGGENKHDGRYCGDDSKSFQAPRAGVVAEPRAKISRPCERDFVFAMGADHMG